MLQPADVLLLDEPTNDLDIPTLEVLEESLLEFEGAIIIISHDRYLMEQVCDACVGLDGEGSSQIYADFTQWQTAVGAPKAKKVNEQVEAEKAKKPVQVKRLSYMDQRDYDRLEDDISKAEQILAVAQSALEDPTLASSSHKLLEATKAVEVAQGKVDSLYTRWEELESKLQ
jgi:ATP-binding cassette subfamily F protein uup